jgi:hypothetical protein
MADPSVLLAPLQGLLTYFQKDRHVRDDKKDAALLAIKKALIESRKYVELSDGESCFDREKEYDLSQLWADAAVKARYVGRDLALRLNDKSAYWSEEFKWSREEVLARRIDFASVEAAVNELLRKP